VFKKNSGSKGIINIDFGHYPKASAILVHNNTFESNSGLMETNVLSIRKQISDFDDINQKKYLAKADLDCAGVQLSDNLFKSNIGCKGTQGAVYLYCIHDAHHGNITYVPSIDSQYITSHTFDPFTLDHNPVQLQNEFSNYTTLSGQVESVNKHRLILRNNTYDGNFAGSKRSIVEIQGFLLVESINETYKNNDNWWQNALEESSEFFKYKSASADVVFFAGDSLNTYPYKSESVLKVQRPLLVILNGTVFDNNRVVDSIDPEGPRDEWYWKQSHGLLISDMGGKLRVVGGTTFSNNAGHQQSGFKNKLIQFERTLFNEVIFDGVKFIGNEAHNYHGTNSMTPTLFNFTKSHFLISGGETERDFDIWSEAHVTLKDYFRLNDIEISENFFGEAEFMVHF
jgi:hypothetical protein